VDVSSLFGKECTTGANEFSYLSSYTAITSELSANPVEDPAAIAYLEAKTNLQKSCYVWKEFPSQPQPGILGTAATFAVLAASKVTNIGLSVVTGDLGVAPGIAVTGFFPPGTVTGGTIHAGDSTALQAQADVTIAYNDLAGRACDTELTGQDLGGLTLMAGVYCFSSSAQLTGDLTLDAQGAVDAEFVFQISSTLTTASDSAVLLVNGANPCNIFWQVGSSATLGATFHGNILALASITFPTGAAMSGRALARNGAVTMDANVISVPECLASTLLVFQDSDIVAFPCVAGKCRACDSLKINTCSGCKVGCANGQSLNKNLYCGDDNSYKNTNRAPASLGRFP
jgi:hypothetical protein